MQIYLIRHTACEVEPGICYGQMNLGLKQHYEVAFENLTGQLPQTNCSIFSSPLDRCRLLAEYIQEKTKTQTPVEYCPELMELNFGDWEGKGWNEINAQELEAWMNDFVNLPIPNGESFTQLHGRVTQFLQTIARAKNKNPVLWITHAGVIRSVLCEVLGIPLQNAFRLKIDYGSISVVHFYGEKSPQNAVEYTNKQGVDKAQ